MKMSFNFRKVFLLIAYCLLLVTGHTQSIKKYKIALFTPLYLDSAFDATGNLFIVDQTGRVIEITTNNVLYTVAGTANAAGNTNGVGTAARFNGPQGIAIDGAGNLYVTDYNNNLIRKIVVTIQ